MRFKLTILQHVSNQNTISQRTTWIFNVTKTYIFFSCKPHVTVKSIPSTLHNIQWTQRCRTRRHSESAGDENNSSTAAGNLTYAIQSKAATVMTELSRLCIKEHTHLSRRWAPSSAAVFSDYPCRFFFISTVLSGVAWHSINVAKHISLCSLKRWWMPIRSPVNLRVNPLFRSRTCGLNDD